MKGNTSNMENNRISAQFSAIDPTIVKNIPTPSEIDVNGKEFVAYGDNNKYPQYLYGLYQDVATLQAVVNGTVDYVCGNEITSPSLKILNRKGETIEDIYQKIASDYVIFGGAYLQVIRDNAGRVAEVYWLDYRNVRSDRKNEVFFYSEDWTKTYGRVRYVVYPKFVATLNQPSSVYFIKNRQSRGVYATPIWGAAIVSAEIEKSINDYHLNAINNSFTGSYIVNLNNGVPSDEQKVEIERNLNEKFSGHENAGRIVISYNSDKDHQCEITPFEVQDFGEKYNTLATRSRQQIAIAFGCNLNLFGAPMEDIGFSSQEYEENFNLYNRTRVRPIQNVLNGAFDKIFGVEGFVNIEPFSLGNNATTNTTVE